MIKKIILISVFIGLVILSGCNQQQSDNDKAESTTPESTIQTTNNVTIEDNKEYAKELLKYGEKTEPRNGYTDSIDFSSPEIGSGKLLNDDVNKPIDKWYLVSGVKTENEVAESKYPLVIDDKCLIHAIGFKNGSCKKYLSLDENKNTIFDGYHGPTMLIYGEVLPDNSVQVSDMVIQQ